MDKTRVFGFEKTRGENTSLWMILHLLLLLLIIITKITILITNTFIIINNKHYNIY